MKVAAVQMCSGPDIESNLRAAGHWVGEATRQGAELVALPENFALMGRRETDKCEHCEPPGEGPVQAFLADTAQRDRVWLIGGTVALCSNDPARVRAACLVYSPKGACVARYDKIHLFDVEVDQGERYAESATIQAGDAPAVVDTPAGRLGLSVCYDLRFPELYRRLVDAGAELAVAPSAFTCATGRAHWDALTRTRAIESLMYVVAPNQVGQHANGRETYGHSRIVGPWGDVLAERAAGEGLVLAELDPTRVQAMRQRFPCLDHRRRYAPTQNWA